MIIRDDGSDDILLFLRRSRCTEQAGRYRDQETKNQYAHISAEFRGSPSILTITHKGREPSCPIHRSHMVRQSPVGKSIDESTIVRFWRSDLSSHKLIIPSATSRRAIVKVYEQLD